MKKFLFANIAVVLLLTASLGEGADKEPLQPPQLSADYAKQRDLILPNPARTVVSEDSVAHLRLARHRRCSEE